jgi:hypothetical protein
MAAGLWHAIIQYASRSLPSQGWAAPPGVSTIEVCDPSGLLPTRDCPTVVSEIFLPGSEPTQPDGLYRAVQINRETGRLATVFTPPHLVEEKVFLIVPPQASEWARAAGFETPPEDYDVLALAPPALSGSDPETAADPAVEVEISSPPVFAPVRGTVNLLGTAAGADFSLFRIQVGQGLNPLAWFQVGENQTEPVEAGVLAAWDTSGLNGLYTVQLQVVRTDQRVDTAFIQLSVDNSAPQVTIQAPLAGPAVTPNSAGALILQAGVQDDLAVQSVNFYVDGRQVKSLSQPPYACPWPAQSGRHTLRVEAVDQAGNTGQAEVDFSINP